MSADRRKKKVPPAVPMPRFPLVIETFRPMGAYEEGQLRQVTPSAFNGMVRFRRYRVTVEEVPESVEVLGARLQALWDECDNHRQWTPIRKAAESIGYVLRGDAGSKRSRS